MFVNCCAVCKLPLSQILLLKRALLLQGGQEGDENLTKPDL